MTEIFMGAFIADSDDLRKRTARWATAGFFDVPTEKAGPLMTITGASLKPVPIPWNRYRDYPVGACAAQKLLMAIFRQAKDHNITKLNMAEIF